MKVTNCKHTVAPHYAKGMCNHCYHLFGRKSAGNAKACAHTDRPNYCKGMCINCYIKGYNKNKQYYVKRKTNQTSSKWASQ